MIKRTVNLYPENKDLSNEKFNPEISYLFPHLMQLQLYPFSLLGFIEQFGLQFLLLVLRLAVVLVAFLQLVLCEAKLVLQL